MRSDRRRGALTDQEPSGFTVVDRRHAAQADAEAAENATTAEAAHSQNSSPEISEPQASAPEADQAAATGSGERFAPDPPMLLSIAAMQMDTHALAKTLLAVFDGHAWQAMGLVAHPLTGEIVKDLPTAQLAIDCVQFLLGKVEGDLSEEERRESQRRLSDLRMNYLAKLRET